jgi:hypothetical protein
MGMMYLNMLLPNLFEMFVSHALGTPKKGLLAKGEVSLTLQLLYLNSWPRQSQASG